MNTLVNVSSGCQLIWRPMPVTLVVVLRSEDVRGIQTLCKITSSVEGWQTCPPWMRQKLSQLP